MISIYDFSILPYALGDVLTWSVKQQIKAINLGDGNIDVLLCDDTPTNLHQEKHITRGNSKSHLTDLIPAFYTNPMVRSVQIFNDREQMMDILPCSQRKEHMDKFLMSREFIHANKTVLDEVSIHEDINEFYARNGKVPPLYQPTGFDTLPIHLSDCKKVIAVHLRSRLMETGLQVTETHRDANLLVWDKFLTDAYKVYPEVSFVLLGRNAHKLTPLLSLKTVICPRREGWSLAQELSLISNCSAFMGSCSGFAVMASFTKTPYLICKCDDRSFLNYGISLDKNQLPFATPHQYLAREETPELLMQHLDRILSI